MQIENSFAVGASPDTVFAFLLDVNRIVGCVPGAELSEVVDPDTFRGKVRIKVGPVTVAYNGTAHITSRDAAARQATLQAEGRETTGSGSARATTTMSVAPNGTGSAVHFVTDFTVVGRVAQFGRGIMEEVSRKLVGQMGECIRLKLEAGEAEVTVAVPPVNGGTPPQEASGSPAPRAAARRARASAGGAGAGKEAPAAAPEVVPPVVATPRPAPMGRVQIAAEPAEAAVPVDALALARSVAVDRLKAAGPGKLVGLAAALFSLAVLVRVMRRRRS